MLATAGAPDRGDVGSLPVVLPVLLSLLVVLSVLFMFCVVDVVLLAGCMIGSQP